jgi:hypothetical protein
MIPRRDGLHNAPRLGQRLSLNPAWYHWLLFILQRIRLHPVPGTFDERQGVMSDPYRHESSCVTD